jgi:hypothetical protein
MYVYIQLHHSRRASLRNERARNLKNSLRHAMLPLLCSWAAGRHQRLLSWFCLLHLDLCGIWERESARERERERETARERERGGERVCVYARAAGKASTHQRLLSLCSLLHLDLCGMCVCVCACERDKVCVCVWVSERERVYARWTTLIVVLPG